ncbi:hypothetical protein MWU57_05520 [Isoptericola sp. S6320L]|uniref:hypothetical protein n=1 Tax=Isoptericola sp. S6320L TaxID=2926411 RepID=UPI001FF53C9B|nr:hypothetical protein [Isoptericola sp. S6320L]MCK0116484.1 hypothetical protein [Isoptericola sp. S6320L]
MAIDPDLVDIALSRIAGTQFEKFSNMFFPAIIGAQFSPLGGMHDGGADAFGGDTVYERNGRAGVFYQASVQVDSKAKIKSTLKRLREFGREPRSLTYLTSRTVPTIDVLEDDLGEELGVVVRIKDAGYIRAHVNYSSTTVAAFEKFLRPETSFLASIGSAPLIAESRHVQSPAVFVYLRQAVDKLDGDLSLTNSVTDGLALWALEGTDPDEGKFMSSTDVMNKINETVPSADTLIRGRVHKRLVAMSKKNYPGGRQVNWHKNDDVFVIPYSTRQQIASQNEADEALRIRILRGLKERARAEFPDLSEGQSMRVAEVSLRAIQFAFEQEGLEFSHFLSREDAVEFPQIGDAVRSAVEEMSVSGPGSMEVAAQCLAVTRACLYHSSEDELEYLGRLARTYSLLFTLSNEPRLVEYFEQMAADFYLYVGSDLLVRALSERYLPESSQLVRNVLFMAARGGVRLILAEPVLEEVINNLRASDREFQNHIESVEHRLTHDMMREVPKILVRAYLYNRDEPHGPTNWPGFVQQFCSFDDLHSPAAVSQLRNYLQATFSMEYRKRVELEDLSDDKDVANLTSKLLLTKSSSELAGNDALLASAVYGRRTKRRETAEASEFGYRTWWFTNETQILRHSRELENKYDCARYMMRPDFLLNFFAFAPNAIDVRRSFANIFPSTLGVQMSRRMDPTAFHKLMAQVKEAESFEDGRRQAVMAECADRLKSDFERRYQIEL